MRLFLALDPPPALRERLGELADIAHARCGGRRVPDENLHLTLAFLGEVNEARGDALVEWVEGLKILPGRWRLDTWGSFRKPGIVWVGGAKPSPALASLHRGLWASLASRHGFPNAPPRFIPHISLLRRADSLSLEGLPDVSLEWSYTQLELFQSVIDDRGARYVSLARSRKH